jgi:dTDP-4-dehydrorhamnose reductase
MKILILGGNGMLGSQLTEVLNRHYEVTTLGRTVSFKSREHIHIDVNSEKNFSDFLKENVYDIIINCVAIINHEYCELNPNESLKVNSLLNQILIENIPDSTFIIYISSDAVFNDKITNRKPSSPTFPKSTYGISKEIGERVLLNSKISQNFLIIRTTIVGFSSTGKGFIEWMVNSIKNNQVITLFDDVKFNPISIYEFSKILLDFITRGVFSREIIHINSTESTTKYDFGLLLAKKLGLNRSFIRRGKLSEFEKKGNRNLDQRIDVNESDPRFPLPRLIDTLITLNNYYENKNSF